MVRVPPQRLGGPPPAQPNPSRGARELCGFQISESTIRRVKILYGAAVGAFIYAGSTAMMTLALCDLHVYRISTPGSTPYTLLGTDPACSYSQPGATRLMGMTGSGILGGLFASVMS